MSNKAMNLVWEHSQQKGNALLVLLAIADMANDDMICYPGKSRLSKKCRLKVRGLTAILQKLEEAGELKIIRRRAGSINATNIYRVTISEGGDESPYTTLVHDGALPSASPYTTPSASPYTTLGHDGAPKPLYNPKNKTKENREPLTPFDILLSKDEEL